MELRQTSVFHTFFLPKRERKYQRKRFRAAARTPRGTGAAPLCQPLRCCADYRDVTAALKMKHSRRLWGNRRTFSAVAMMFRRRRQRGRGLRHTLTLHPCQEAHSFKMSAAERKSFSYIFIGEANKNIDSAKEVRTHRVRGNFGV